MAVRVAEKSDAVSRCVARQDGGWMVVTHKGQSGVSPSEIPIGTRVIIRDGKVERQQP